MIRKIAVIVTAFFISGCGSSIISDGEYSVENVNFLANDIDVGESVRTEIFFQTKTEFDGAADGVQVVVKISSALRYLPGSSEIYDDSTEDSDSRSPDQVVTCPDGSTYLFYNFDDSELDDRSLVGSFDFGFKIEVFGVSRTRSAVISASAAENQQFSCFSDFEDEESDSIEVK